MQQSKNKTYLYYFPSDTENKVGSCIPDPCSMQRATPIAIPSNEYYFTGENVKM
jgi:hypothetical protein